MYAHVKQKHARGCGPACLAMILRKSYDEVLAFPIWAGKNWDHGGIDYLTLDNVLTEYGVAVARRHIMGLPRIGPPPTANDREDRAMRTVWPVFWSDIHLCQTHTREYTHFVVALRDGSILDPMLDGVQPSAKYTFNWIAAAYLVG